MFYLVKEYKFKIREVYLILVYCTVGELPWKRKKICVFLLRVMSFQELYALRGTHDGKWVLWGPGQDRNVKGGFEGTA